MKKRTVQQEVSQLFSGELLSGIGFFFIWLGVIILDLPMKPIAMQSYVFITVINLSLILITGSYFWYIMKQAISKRKQVSLTTAQYKQLMFLRRMIELLLIIATIAVILNVGQMNGATWFLYIFMVVEYINYFQVRLSYLSFRELKQFLIHKRPHIPHLKRALNKFNKV